MGSAEESKGRGGAYLSDVHGELVLRLTVLVAERADERRAVVFGVLEAQDSNRQPASAGSVQSRTKAQANFASHK